METGRVWSNEPHYKKMATGMVRTAVLENTGFDSTRSKNMKLVGQEMLDKASQGECGVAFNEFSSKAIDYLQLTTDNNSCQ